MFGYTLEDIPTGRDWFRLAFPDPGHRRQIEDAWREDLRDIPAGESRPRTFDVRCKDGEVKTILFLPVTISSGGQFVLYVDISERLRAEQALKESEGRYRDLFDSISDFICTHDLEGRLLTINETASQAAGVKAREMVGRNLREFVPPQFQEAFDREYLPAIRAKGYSEGVTKFLARDGQARYLEYRNRLVREPGQQPLVIASARDVTQRIMAERELRRLEEQLLRSQKIEAVGVLAGGIAHDFNNVLQAISGYAQLLSAEDGLSPVGRERLESIGRSIERAARMINQLMTLAHKVETRRERVDLNQEVRQTVAILEHTLPRMISIRTDLEDRLKAISGDPGQVEQIMLNLATNAGHAMPQGGRSEERRVGKECRRLCRSRWSPYH
jgi:PAS domain S-box-containing protein